MLRAWAIRQYPNVHTYSYITIWNKTLNGHPIYIILSQQKAFASGNLIKNNFPTILHDYMYLYKTYTNGTDHVRVRDAIWPNWSTTLLGLSVYILYSSNIVFSVYMCGHIVQHFIHTQNILLILYIYAVLSEFIFSISFQHQPLNRISFSHWKMWQ